LFKYEENGEKLKIAVKYVYLLYSSETMLKETK